MSKLGNLQVFEVYGRISLAYPFYKIDFKKVQIYQLTFYQNALKLANLRFFEATR